MSEISDIKISCADGHALAGTYYKSDNGKGAVLIGPATGIKRRFYHSFASHLLNNGYNVLTFDNRGIGDSGSESKNNIDASLINWGRLDMSAALNELIKRAPNSNYHLVGHSAGGQLVGLMDNALKIKSIFNFACSSGSIRNMKYPFKVSAIFFMNIFIPLNNLFFGQTNSQWVGMGEPLPKKVASQWTKWCNGKGYVETDFGKDILHHYYNDLKMPSMWLHAADDSIANYKNVKDMVRVFTKSQAEIKTLNPKEYGFKEIGHMKYFSSKRKDLWKYALDWFEKNDNA